MLLSLFGEVWFLAKTIMAAGMGAAGALLMRSLLGLLLSRLPFG